MSNYLKFWHRGKALRVHRTVAALKIGRELRGREVVHHIDGNKLNNNPDNLTVMPSQAHHMVLEWLQRKRGRGVIALFSDVAFVEARGAASKPVKIVDRPGVLELPAHEDSDLVPLFPEVMM